MEKSIYDLWVDEIVDRQSLVRAELKERFKKTKPFRMEKMSPKERLDYYNSLTTADMDNLIQTEGPDTVNNFIREMEGGI